MHKYCFFLKLDITNAFHYFSSFLGHVFSSFTKEMKTIREFPYSFATTFTHQTTLYAELPKQYYWC